MLIPLGTNNFDQKRFPYVCTLLIILNVIVFMLQSLDENLSFTLGYSLIPQEILTGRDVVDPIREITLRSGLTVRVPGPDVTWIPVHLTLLTSMFMHGDLWHLLFNMIYLFVFGSSIENKLGHKTFAGFYLGCGVLASLLQVAAIVLTKKDLLIPMLGASGAISGVMGAFMILCPHQKIKTLLFIFVRFTTFYMSAWAFLGIWILWQLVDSASPMEASSSGGVAYVAHISGFFAGLVYAQFIFEKDEEDEAPALVPNAPGAITSLPKQEYNPMSFIKTSPSRADSNASLNRDQALRLRCEEGLRVGECYELQPKRTLIGRADPMAGIVVDIDLSAQEDGLTPRSVSRQHAVIERAADGYFLIDKGSHNGSELNGAKLAAGKLHALRAGDRLSIGAITLVAESIDPS